MKIEYLEAGPPEAPLIRIYGDDPATAAYLAEALEQLADGRAEMIMVHELPGIEPVGEVRLLARAGDEDRGVKPSRAPGLFDMMLTQDAWGGVAEVAWPFCEPAGEDVHSEWLDRTGEFPVIITTSDSGEF